MKKAISLLFAALLLACPLFGTTAHAAEKRTPVYAESITDGTYPIEVTSSSSMFRIIACELTVSEGEMTAVMTLSGHGYEKLFMGTGEEALAASDSDYVYYAENDEGMYTYTVPVEALDRELDCAAWSIRKEKWYDRTIVFEADTLPSGTVQGGFHFIVIIAAAIAVMAAVIVGIILFRKRRGA